MIPKGVREGERQTPTERRAETADADADHWLRNAFDPELGTVWFDLRRLWLRQAERVRLEQLRHIAGLAIGWRQNCRVLCHGCQGPTPRPVHCEDVVLPVLIHAE